MEVTVERILPGGLGLAHAEGKTIMVALAAPGDHLRIRIEKEKGSVAFAAIEEILTPSPDRIEPPCPYFGRCGGCDFQQLNYDAQLSAKKEIIKDCLRRIAGLEAVAEFEMTAAGDQWHYRARAQWQYDSLRKRLGYFETGSRRVCDVAECAVLAPQLQAALGELRAEMNAGLLADGARYYRSVVGDHTVSIASGLNEKKSRTIRRTIRGEAYEFRAESFFQANAALLPQLIEAALAHAAGQSALELYSGVGLFTIPLARQVGKVIAIEDDKSAADFARRNLQNSGLTSAEVIHADVGDWLEEKLNFGLDGALNPSATASSHPDPEAAPLQIDFLLLDPPRTGAESRVINGILRMRPRRICYVSCDPATLARDLKKLLAGGYTLEGIVAFDMFPQTHHVETVVHLTI